MLLQITKKLLIWNNKWRTWKNKLKKKDTGATLIFQKTYTLKNSNKIPPNTKYSAAYALNFFIKPPGSLVFQLLFKCMLSVLYILQILTNSLIFLIPSCLWVIFPSCSTVDAPLTDHIWQFRWYFSYLFKLNIWHFIFQKYCFYAI